MMIGIVGASGFVGRELVKICREQRSQYKAFSRCGDNGDVNSYRCPDLTSTDGWEGIFEGIDSLIITSGRAHIVKDDGRDTLERFREVNVRGLHNVLKGAYSSSVKKIVLVSSIKVNGENTSDLGYFDCQSDRRPLSAYGVSKAEAEERLIEFCKDRSIGYTIARPTLLYGPGVKANFLRLLRLIEHGAPIPYCEGVTRSYAYNRWFCESLLEDAAIKNTSNIIYAYSDIGSISVDELARRLGYYLGKKPWLIRLPKKMLKYGAHILKKESYIPKLAGCMNVRSSYMQERSAEEIDKTLEETARWYLASQERR